MKSISPKDTSRVVVVKEFIDNKTMKQYNGSMGEPGGICRIFVARKKNILKSFQVLKVIYY